MDLVSLATTTLTLAMPYIIKTGEKIAENVGEEIWEYVKKIFVSEKDKPLLTADLRNEENQENLKTALINKLSENNEIEIELGKIIEHAKNQLSNNQQIINNNGNVEKQINIQNNSGNIQL